MSSSSFPGAFGRIVFPGVIGRISISFPLLRLTEKQKKLGGEFRVVSFSLVRGRGGQDSKD